MNNESGNDPTKEFCLVLNPQRRDDESLDQYKNRRKIGNLIVKQLSKGRLGHNSTLHGTYKKKK